MKWLATIGDCKDVTALITDRLAVTATSSNLTCARPATERDATATDKHSKLLTNVFVASVLDGTQPCLQILVQAPPYTSTTPDAHIKVVVTFLEGIYFAKH